MEVYGGVAHNISSRNSSSGGSCVPCVFVSLLFLFALVIFAGSSVAYNDYTEINDSSNGIQSNQVNDEHCSIVQGTMYMECRSLFFSFQFYLRNLKNRFRIAQPILFVIFLHVNTQRGAVKSGEKQINFSGFPKSKNAFNISMFSI